jgi:hypothetical protein
MLRRCFLAVVPAGLWSWRVHVLAKHECARGGMLLMVLQGEPSKLTDRERKLVDETAAKFHELEPEVLQQRLPKNL